MLGSIALSVLLALIVAGLAVVHFRGRRAAGSWHLLRDLSPVVKVDPALAKRARVPIDRMVAIG